MLEHVLTNIPLEARGQVGWVALAGAIIGAVFWMAGARFSRSILTLAAVAVGAFIGLRVPRWTALPVDDWAAGILGALLMGVCAFALHRLWASVILAVLLALWGVAGAWAVYGPGSEWHLPSWQEGASVAGYCRAAYEGLPGEIRRVGPLACGIGLISGLTLGLLWSRMALVLLYSVLGTTLMLGLGTLAVEMRWPDLMRYVPSAGKIQWMIAGGMVGIGVLVQWLLIKATSPAAAPAAEGKQD